MMGTLAELDNYRAVGRRELLYGGTESGRGERRDRTSY